jgi:hypothetical protein
VNTAGIPVRESIHIPMTDGATISIAMVVARAAHWAARAKGGRSSEGFDTPAEVHRGLSRRATVAAPAALCQSAGGGIRDFFHNVA